MDPQKNCRSQSSMGLKYRKLMEVDLESHTSPAASQVAAEGSSFELIAKIYPRLRDLPSAEQLVGAKTQDHATKKHNLVSIPDYGVRGEGTDGKVEFLSWRQLSRLVIRRFHIGGRYRLIGGGKLPVLCGPHVALGGEEGTSEQYPI